MSRVERWEDAGFRGPPDDTPLLCRRFEWLLKHHFGDSITLMAAAVGASHAALSRVLNHGQPPSAQMIEGLARSGRIDLNWLLLGEWRGGAGDPGPGRPGVRAGK